MDEYGLYPTSALKYLLEGLGAYQDFSGTILDELIVDELDEIHIENLPFLCRKGEQNPETNPNFNEVREATYALFGGLTDNRVSGLMAELSAYVALSDTYLQLRDRVPMSLLPKGRWELLNYVDWEVDCQLFLGGTNYAIDVSNSIQHTMVTYEKINQHMQWKDRGRLSPVLLNRMSSRVVKELYTQWNSLCCDVEELVVLDDSSTRTMREGAEFLGIADRIYWVPPLAVAGERLDGQSYDRLVKSGDFIPHPEVFAPAADTLPVDYMKKLRGLVRLLYINGLYRQAPHTKGRVTALLIQSAFNYLLRNPSGTDRETVLGYARGRLGRGFARAYRRNEEMHKDEFIDYMTYLNGLGFLRTYGDKISIADATHPLTYF